MNSITQKLLAGAAFGALATASAMAEDVPPFHAVALYPGHATFVSKTRMHSMHKGPVNHSSSYTSCSYVVTTSVPASDFHTVVKSAHTYYTYYDSGSFCNSSETQYVKLAKKRTRYAKLGKSTETLSGYCSTADTVFYGDTYDLKKRKGFGKTDSFVSTLVGKGIHYNGEIYNINTNLDVSVAIGR